MRVGLPPFERALLACGSLAGLLGVGLSAAAAHVPGADSLKTAAQFLLFHAPALLALAGLSGVGLVRVPAARAAGGLIVLGLLLFCGDLSCRALAGVALFPMAAPSGGIALMAGWAAGLILAILPRPRGPASDGAGIGPAGSHD